jgi:hypothetical protein
MEENREERDGEEENMKSIEEAIFSMKKSLSDKICSCSLPSSPCSLLHSPLDEWERKVEEVR